MVFGVRAAGSHLSAGMVGRKKLYFWTGQEFCGRSHGEGSMEMLGHGGISDCVMMDKGGSKAFETLHRGHGEYTLEDPRTAFRR